jgi:DNA-binding NarL/FixJ family response regulator
MPPTATDIRVVIADDHPIFRKGLREILATDRELLIVGEAADGEQALDLIRTTGPHIAVLDVDMPRKSGIAVASEVRALGLDVGIMFLTMHKNERFFNAALDVGVRGYMLKETASTDIIEGIKAVAGGRSYVTPALSDYLINRHRASASDDGTPLASLTPTERRILRFVAEYKTSQEIADALFISIRTVDRHRANIAGKLDLSGAHALQRFASEHKTEL